MSIRRYASAEDFRRALESRLRAGAGHAGEVDRRRRLLASDRLLARLAAELGQDMLLKGGLVLEVRLARARATRDVDLSLPVHEPDFLARFRLAMARDLGDHFQFEVGPRPVKRGTASDFEFAAGTRFVVTARLAKKLFVHPFGVDVGFGDPIVGDVEARRASDTLAFAAIPPPVLRLVPVETHVAEKLHAYTLPRKRPNSRVKDLPDIALLASTRVIQASTLRTAIETTFAHRITHPLPSAFPMPDEAWTVPYGRLAESNGLPWRDLAGVHRASAEFLDPVLSGAEIRVWDPKRWSWERDGPAT
jgi:hypothetical protein